MPLLFEPQLKPKPTRCYCFCRLFVLFFLSSFAVLPPSFPPPSFPLKQLSGCRMLSFLGDRLDHPPHIRRPFATLHRECLRVFLQHVADWAVYGVLSDTRGDFFVARCKDVSAHAMQRMMVMVVGGGVCVRVCVCVCV